MICVQTRAPALARACIAEMLTPRLRIPLRSQVMTLSLTFASTVFPALALCVGLEPSPSRAFAT